MRVKVGGDGEVVAVAMQQGDHVRAQRGLGKAQVEEGGGKGKAGRRVLREGKVAEHLRIVVGKDRSRRLEGALEV